MTARIHWKIWFFNPYDDHKSAYLENLTLFRVTIEKSFFPLGMVTFQQETVICDTYCWDCLEIIKLSSSDDKVDISYFW